MKFAFILIALLFNVSSFGGELAAPTQAEISKFQTQFDNFTDEGKYVIYDNVLKKDNLELTAVSLKYYVNCKNSSTIFEARLKMPIEAKGELSGLGAAVLMVTIHHNANGKIEIYPVMGAMSKLETHVKLTDKEFSCKL